MNERIKELRHQAINYCMDKGSQGNLSEEVAEKFAELIVRQCAQICKTVGGDQVSASKDYQEGREMGTEVCYNMIKKHFGVE
jgi:hypothetical protein